MIIVDDDMATKLPAGVKGNILVRGPPCFGGYENDAQANKESFFTIEGQEGWFNTGDMGSLDAAGYLFISGRSKEIINRGGETISPFEIEEAVLQHPLVKETLAFSAPHAEYQESIGVVVVTHPTKPRIDLPSLHKFVEDKLHRSKWPQLIVFMSALPKNAAGKILRIRLGERLQLAAVDEESAPARRLHSATCPPVGTPLSQPIECTQVVVDFSSTEEFLRHLPKVTNAAVIAVDLPGRQDACVAFVSTASLSGAASDQAEVLLKECQENLHQYLAPVVIHILPSLPTQSVSPAVDREALQKIALRLYAEKSIVLPRNAIETQLEAIWRAQLGAASSVSVATSFFDLGGDSLKAGQLVAVMRKKMRVQLSVADLFTASTIEKMAHKIATLKTLGSPSPNPQSARQASGSTTDPALPGAAGLYATSEHMSFFSNTSFACLVVQALPIAVVYPISRLLVWYLFASLWVGLMKFGHRRFETLVAAMLITRLLAGVIGPLTG